MDKRLFIAKCTLFFPYLENVKRYCGKKRTEVTIEVFVAERFAIIVYQSDRHFRIVSCKWRLCNVLYDVNVQNERKKLSE